ncbi:hypothetical protein SBA5_480003 [Candidatus Sulfotelmatomonas gaucii]|uniref:Uncharacterized protein n=1 Tax=Candidatus Sulfuritelmatomonas gaucii TaxID=2043161 RepID=A0A2N9LPL1_9BACT|nr:hypothetical protein SBA5_480003 [Candidatus Sulfotelmatomonas gaucii]
MKTITNQVISGTQLDLHGERNTKEALESFVERYAGKRMPLNQQHDLALKSFGYVENLRIVPDEGSPGNWFLIGDVHYEGESPEFPVGGLSISFVEMLRRCETQDLLHVYLPYPYYNDHKLVEDLFEEGFTSVGKWRKKAVEPFSTALIAGVIIFVIKPIWEDLYKTQIAPHVYKFFAGKFKKLQGKNIGVNFLQQIVHNNCQIQVILIPTPGKEEYCFSVEQTNAAMALVHSCLTSQDLAIAPAEKMVLQFDDENDCYVLRRIEHEDGSLTEPV